MELKFNLGEAIYLANLTDDEILKLATDDLGNVNAEFALTKMFDRDIMKNILNEAFNLMSTSGDTLEIVE